MASNLESKLIPYDAAPAKVTRLDESNIRIEYKGRSYEMGREPSKYIPGEIIYPYCLLDKKGNKKEIADYDTFMMLYVIYQRFLEAEVKDEKKQ